VSDFNPVTDELGGMLSNKNSDLPNPSKQSKRTAGPKKAKKMVQQPQIKQRPGEKMIEHEYGKYLDGSQEIQGAMKRSSQSHTRIRPPKMQGLLSPTNAVQGYQQQPKRQTPKAGSSPGKPMKRRNNLMSPTSPEYAQEAELIFQRTNLNNASGANVQPMDSQMFGTDGSAATADGKGRRMKQVEQVYNNANLN